MNNIYKKYTSRELLREYTRYIIYNLIVPIELIELIEDNK